ncbi:25S rRNA (adenine2142-N1)-methyltransferase [Friedmanniomyces endolithicus]|nr:25S rRNA (adenine2142-N1)-methyltransferase [Friedmanniomyces endolithicus]KAK1825225.1 25S rRNA (adenine2142-N1)-methyltransferase [Friedmanniomyces endolithicus]
MRNSILACVGLLAVNAIAAPNNGGNPWNGWGYSGNGRCMNDDQANKVANNFRDLISAYTTTLANSVLTTTVQDYSDSVIELIDGGCPSGPIALGSATFASRASFEAGQGSQPNITFNILNVWHNCDTVTVRWRLPMPNPGPGAAPAVQEEVTGIAALETVWNGWQSSQQFLINMIYSEFNSGAWLYDLEIFKPANCAGARRTRSLPSYFSQKI